MDILVKIIQFFLCFTILIGIHEMGHFIMARRISGLKPKESKDITTPNRPDRYRCSFQGDTEKENDKNHNVMREWSVAVFVTQRINYPCDWRS